MASTPIQLIDLEEAKRQVHVDLDVTDHDDDIDLKISMASSIVMDLIKLSDIPDSWIETHSPLVFEAPFAVKAMVLITFAEMYYNREASTINIFSPTMNALLTLYRKPTLA